MSTVISASEVASLLGVTESDVLFLSEESCMPAPLYSPPLDEFQWDADYVRRWVDAGCPRDGQRISEARRRTPQEAADDAHRYYAEAHWVIREGEPYAAVAAFVFGRDGSFRRNPEADRLIGKGCAG